MTDTLRPSPSIEPIDLMNGLAKDARAIDAASERLGQRIKEFEGVVRRDPKDPASEIVELGLKLRWEGLIDEQLAALEDKMYDAARDPENKLPAALKSRPIRAMEAEARINAKLLNPTLWAEHAEAEAEIHALQVWIKAKERAGSLRQSILSAQRQVAGMD